MSDNLDRSAEHQELILKSQIATRKDTGNVTPTGTCHYCKESVAQPKLFCDGDCADDFDRITNPGYRRI